MRKTVLAGILGKFLKIYGLLMILPLSVALLYQEGLLTIKIFAISSFLSLFFGFLMDRYGEIEDPSISEAIILTVSGWFFAAVLGAIPLSFYMPALDALFESFSGFTTTGISLILEPSQLPHSILFWRSFMQWIGGLGILTFFIAVIRQSGGISRRLFSAEAHKTDPGSIRPSLMKSIIDLWRVYGFLTSTLIGLFVIFGMSVFDAVNHAFTTLSTGGFSTSAASLGAFNPSIQAVTVFFMFLGGMNFVLIYRLLRTDSRPLRKNSEFRLYTFIFLLITVVSTFNLLQQGNAEPILNGAFQSAALVSSTGFGTMEITVFASALQVVFLGVMFVGGSLGSTTGGVKMFRLKAMLELLKTRIKAYSLPDTAINKVKIDGEILDSDAIRTISVLFFTWISAAFLISIFLVLMEGFSFSGALSVAISSIGNMGPVYVSGEQLVAMSPVSKLLLAVGMLAGRLEMLPLLAIFNRRLIKQ
jgi:trk system potassium uptake protein TrkH